MLTILDTLFAPGAATALSLSSADCRPLAVEETEISRTWDARRIVEFQQGRSCARYALARLGMTPDIAILVGRNREPLWPAGVVGSISHADNLAAAVVARDADFLALGLDLEPAQPLDHELIERVCRSEEIDRLPRDPLEARRQAKLYFSAKEAAYKALWPSLRRFLDFSDLGIRLDADARRFSIITHSSSCPPGMAEALHGRYLETHGFFATGVLLRPGAAG